MLFALSITLIYTSYYLNYFKIFVLYLITLLSKCCFEAFPMHLNGFVKVFNHRN